jgi:hypothetical protein
LASRPEAEKPVQEFEIELGIGDTLRIGDSIYTVIDIENGEVCFRIDPADEFAPALETVRPGK